MHKERKYLKIIYEGPQNYEACQVFPLFKDMCFCFPHPMTVTLLDLTKEDTRYTVLLHTNYSVGILLHTNYSVGNRNYELTLCKMRIIQAPKKVAL
jgi:hypothetical protein